MGLVGACGGIKSSYSISDLGDISLYSQWATDNREKSHNGLMRYLCKPVTFIMQSPGYSFCYHMKFGKLK